jgi:hypothetical protein
MSGLDWREMVSDEAMPLAFQQTGELPAEPEPVCRYCRKPGCMDGDKCYWPSDAELGR